ncbi:MAG: hypothetical protein AB1424_16500 [Thermodesulfobacteriota bacterium]
MMTQGVIVYLMGGGKPPGGLQPGAHYQGLTNPQGPLEIVVSRPGILELDDAWHFLLSLGCESIQLLVATAKHDRLHPLYPLVRLRGVERVAENHAGAGWHGRVLH